MTEPNQPRPAMRFRGEFATDQAKKQTNQIDKSKNIGTFVDIGASRTKVALAPVVKSVEVNKSGNGAKLNPQHLCKYCDRLFIWKKDLYKHMRLKHPKEWDQEQSQKEEEKLGLMFKCDACGEKFFKKQALKDHRRRKHTKEELVDAKRKIETHKCDHCQRGHLTYDARRMCQKRCLLKLAIEVKEELSEEQDDQNSEGTDLDEAEPKLGQIMKGSDSRVQSHRAARINAR